MSGVPPYAKIDDAPRSRHTDNVAEARAGHGPVAPLIEFFVPGSMRSDAEDNRRARLFLGSHIFGPVAGLAVVAPLFAMDAKPGAPPWIMAGAIAAFWIFPFLLRATGSFRPLALLSLLNLAFIVLFGAFHYGGVGSPFLPWLLTIPLFAFFYLGDDTRLQIGVLMALGSALAAFYAAHVLGYAFPQHVPLGVISGLSVVSIFCVGVYVTAMATYHTRVVAAHAVLEREIETQRATTRLLQAAKDAAQSASRAKSEFVAVVSHELRTPLNAIKGFSEIMKSEAFGPLGNAKYRAYIQDIYESGDHLLEIINDILEVAKLEIAELDLVDEVVDLSDVVASACRLMRQRAEQAKITIVSDVPLDLPLLRADKRRVKQALLNLLSNAVKFTPAGGYIEVVASRGGASGPTLAVRDNGIGIAPEHLQRIGEVFFQADSSLARRYEGLGLGLSVVSAIMARHGGKLVVDSEPGKGTTARLAFPPDRTVPRPAAPPAGERQDAPEPLLPASAASPPRPVAARGVCTILVVDDDETMRDVLKRMLERTGFDVVTAIHGRDALAKFQQRYADLVITDLNMPEMDGIELIRSLTTDHPTVSIVVISGVADRLKLIDMALRLGAKAAIQKPVMRQEVVQTVRRLLKVGASVQEAAE